MSLAGLSIRDVHTALLFTRKRFTEPPKHPLLLNLIAIAPAYARHTGAAPIADPLVRQKYQRGVTSNVPVAALAEDLASFMHRVVSEANGQQSLPLAA